MKFSPIENFKEGFITYEAGNTYDSEAQGLSDGQVMAYWAAGWAEVEGRDPAPARQTNNVEVVPNKADHAEAASEPS